MIEPIRRMPSRNSTPCWDYLPRQSWASADHTAWVGHSLGAQTELEFLLQHPERQPQLLVRLSGGWVPELGNAATPTGATLKSIHSQVLIVHGDHDAIFPVQDARTLATVLQTNGIPVVAKIFEGEDHGFSEDWPVLIRLTGEYCQRMLNPGHPFAGAPPLHLVSIWLCLAPAALATLFFAYLYWSTIMPPSASGQPREETGKISALVCRGHCDACGHTNIISFAGSANGRQ